MIKFADYFPNFFFFNKINKGFGFQFYYNPFSGLEIKYFRFGAKFLPKYIQVDIKYVGRKEIQ